MTSGILILDFGSQFTQLIARRVREMGVYSEIVPFNTPVDKIQQRNPVGIVLSGGPTSVFEDQAPKRDDLNNLLEIAPTLGICYGMQLFCHQAGGKVESSPTREYGRMPVKWLNEERETEAWMSHGDLVVDLPPGSRGLGKSQNGHWAAMENREVGKGFWGLQFHPEVSHTQDGTKIIKDFVFEKAGAQVNWNGELLVEHLVEDIRQKVGPEDHVLCALSGGVDSTVTASLLTKALGRERVHSVLVDTGLLRHNEVSDVMAAYKKADLDVTCVDASQKFLSELDGVEDPEVKRKTIGRIFIEVFDEATKKLPRCGFLAQGTLYPDVIESVNIYGQSVTIKSHHNVGGLPEKMNLKLVEPLRELFKDEVRVLGKQLGLDPQLLGRHPFPGPGLAIRIIGAVNEEDLGLLKKADHIFISELREKGLYDKIWQAFVALLPVKSVGVMGDGRTYERVAALRAITSLDGMTADWYPFDTKFLAHVSNRITNEVKGINRVVYDISSKPPATIEWE